MFEDQIFWYIDTFPTGTTFGSWTFIHNNPGVDQKSQTAVDNHFINNKNLIKIIDLFGRETTLEATNYCYTL